MSMPAFWIASGALALLAALFVAWPARRSRVDAEADEARDARRAENVAAYRQQRQELEVARAMGRLDEAGFATAVLELDRRLLADAAALEPAAGNARGGRGLLLAAALAVPMLALLVYHQFGAYEEVELAEMMSELSGPLSPEERRERLAKLLPWIEKQADRRDPQGSYRFMLARVYAGEGRYDAAAPLFVQLADLYPDDADMAAQAAQTLFLAHGGKLDPEVKRLAERALAIEPHHPGVRGMLGMASFEAGDYARAIEHWQVLLAGLPPDSPEAGMVRGGIEAAEARLAPSVSPVSPDEGQAPAPAGP